MKNDLPQKLYAKIYNENFTFDLLFSSKPRSVNPQQYWIEDDYQRECWLKLSGSNNAVFIHSFDAVSNHRLTHSNGHDFLSITASDQKD